MLDRFEQMLKQTNVTQTENGAKAYKTTESALLDLFKTGGIARELDDTQLFELFRNAYAEDKLLTLKTMFYLRDCRGGVGERQTFRRLLSFMPTEDLKKLDLIELILEYGRFDDILILLDYPETRQIALKEMKEIVNTVLTDEQSEFSYFVWKFLPSNNVSSRRTVSRARIFAKYMGFNQKSYRKMLAKKRLEHKVFEAELTQKGFKDIDFASLPSRCLNKYKKAFYRHLEEDYEAFLDKASNGEVKVNSSQMFVYEVLKNMLSYDEQEAQLGEAQWLSLPNFLEGYENTNVVCVADISASMTADDCKPMYNSIGLATYFAQRNTGLFANKYVLFSDEAFLMELPKGLSNRQSVKYVKETIKGDIYGTNIESVFKTLYKATKQAVKDKTYKKGDCPVAMLIITDEQFDSIVNDDRNAKTIVETYKDKFSKLAKKYDVDVQLPNIVFWNVRQCSDTNKIYQALANDIGIQMYSGYSASIFKNIMSSLGCTPYEAMIKTLSSDRYANVKFK